MMFAKPVAGLMCLLALGVAQAVSAQATVRHGEHEMHSGIPHGFKYLPLPSGPHLAMAIFTPTPESQFPYDAQISVILDKAGPAAAIDSQYNRARDAFKSNCTGNADARVLAQGTQNNYAYSEWLLTCDADKSSGKPKFAVMKTIVGQSFVYAYEYDISTKVDDAAVKVMKDYLDVEGLCDDTSAQHPCQPAN